MNAADLRIKTTLARIGKGRKITERELARLVRAKRHLHNYCFPEDDTDGTHRMLMRAVETAIERVTQECHHDSPYMDHCPACAPYTWRRVPNKDCVGSGR